MKTIQAIKAVYCFYFPEVRRVIEEVINNFDHRLLLKSVFPGLDNYHERLIGKFVEKSAGYQQGLAEFEHRYFCNGSSEAIFHLLVDSEKINKPIYILRGEYEGYREYARNIGLPVVEVEADWRKIKQLPLGRWFISNPSARDGNIINNSFINKLGDLGHELVIDIAYLGLTKKKVIDLRHKNIVAVVASLSKPYGLFYYRIGFLFSRQEKLTIYPNKWFKNILSIQIGEKILEKYGFGYFYRKYLSWQKRAVRELSMEIGQKVEPSDVLLLAHSQAGPREYKRDKSCRFCLTPYFLKYG